MKKLVFAPVFLATMLLAVLAAAPEAKRPRIVGLTHIAVRVHNMEASRHFYGDLLGFQEAFTVGRAVFFKVNDRQYIVVLPESKPEDQRFIDYALETDDAEALRLYLKAQGYRVPDKPAAKGPTYNLSFHMADPDDNA